MDVPDVFGDVFDFGLVKQGRKSLGRHGGQDVQGAPEGQAGVAVILGPLVAAAVGAVVLEEAVQAVGGLPDGGPPLFLAHVGQQEKAKQDVLGAPAGPVAHGLVPVAHPTRSGRGGRGVRMRARISPLHPAWSGRGMRPPARAPEGNGRWPAGPRPRRQTGRSGGGRCRARAAGECPGRRRCGRAGCQALSSQMAQTAPAMPSRKRPRYSTHSAAARAQSLARREKQAGPPHSARWPVRTKSSQRVRGSGARGRAGLGLAGGKQPGCAPKRAAGPHSARPAAGGTGPEGGQRLGQVRTGVPITWQDLPYFCWYSRGLRPVDFLKTLEK